MPEISSQSRMHCSNLVELLVNDNNFRDVKFVLQEGTTVEAHMSVLAVRSPVFGKILSSNMVESKSKSIELFDVNPEAMQIFVDALYEIEIPDNLEIGVWESIFWLCDKYQVDFLIPKLLMKTTSMPSDKLFASLFGIFQKIPKFRHYITDHESAFIIDVLKVHPKSRTQEMQDFLLRAHLCSSFQGYS